MARICVRTTVLLMLLLSATGCAADPSPKPPPRLSPAGSPPVGAVVRLQQGTAATHGFHYAVSLHGFAPDTAVEVRCRDTVTPDGFKSFTVMVDKAGAWATDRACYSGEGAEHWVTAAGIESNRVTWTDAGSSGSARTVILRKGAQAPAGYWYSISLDGFSPAVKVTVICRDSTDTEGFKTFSITVGSGGNASMAQACYSGDGPAHWVTVDGTTSNKITW